MPAVKGSKQHKMIVVPHRPVLLWWLGAICLGALALVASLGYFAGHAVANYHANAVLDMPLAGNAISLARAKDIARNPEQLIAILRENATLKQTLVSLEQSAAVDKEALASVQDSLVTQRDTIAQLQEDLLFYKQIAVPENAEAERGLVIGRFDLVATKAPQHLRYKIEFRQQGGADKLEGHANVNVVGDQDGQRVSLPLNSLSTKEQELDIPLSFRYFQNIEGELILPEGFTPERVQVLAVAAGDDGKRAEKSFSWSVRD